MGDEREEKKIEKIEKVERMTDTKEERVFAHSLHWFDDEMLKIKVSASRNDLRPFLR